MAQSEAAAMFAEQLQRKFTSENVKCGVPKKTGERYCDAPGHLALGYFCGRYKQLADSESFNTIMAGLQRFGSTLAAVVGVIKDQKDEVLARLAFLALENKAAKSSAECQAQALKGKIEGLQAQVKSQKEKVAKTRGERVCPLYRVLEIDLRVFFTQGRVCHGGE